MWHERDISHSSVERVTFADACALLDYMLEKMRWVIEGLVVDADRMQANLDASMGLVHSQSVLTALLSKGTLQREEAYALVQRNAMTAWDTQAQLSDLLKADKDVLEHLDGAEIDACFRPDRYLGNLDTVFRRLEEL